MLDRIEEEERKTAVASAPAVREPAVKVDGFQHRPGSSSYKLAGGYKLPAEVFEKLFKYQREGVRWMWSLHRREAGGVLADEMGLGKTVQVAAFLRGLFASKLVETVLIVMPKSVVENWRKEIAHWTRRLVLTFEGTKNQRARILEQIAEQGGILLTTYGMVRTNADTLVGLENPRSGVLEQWDYVILDEGHKIKNSSSEGAKCMKQIEAPHKLVLTGTPILNQLMELWALYDYAQPGLLGDAKLFRREFDEPIVRASHKNAKAEHKLQGEACLQRLKHLIQPHFLRRVKEDVFGQREPPAAAAVAVEEEQLLDKYRIKVRKNDLICWVSMSKVQVELYDKFLTMPEVKEIFNTSKSPLAAITVLKKICLHPQLLHSNMKTLREADPSAAGAELLEGSVAALLARLSAADGPAAEEQSGKLSFALTLIEQLLREGHRVLVFSQWQKMLDILEAALAARRVLCARMDGSVTKNEERQRLIDTFNGGGRGCANVFLLTTQVGGLGITLTGADRAIIYDPSWNCVDDQAVDRIYRIGQQRNCVIYRLITCGTVEEKIYRKQVFKGGLSRMISAGAAEGVGSQTGAGYFTKDELRALFTLENPYESITQKQLQAENAGRRNTDAELDRHIDFLGTIANFHGVTDHDLLYDSQSQCGPAATPSVVGVPSAAAPELEPEAPADAAAIDMLVHDISVVLNDDDVHDRSLVIAESRGPESNVRVRGMTIMTPSPMAKKHRRVEKEKEEEEEEEEEAANGDDSFVVPDDMDISLTLPAEEEPEIHYRGPRIGKKQPAASDSKRAIGEMVERAKELEQSGRAARALDKYMDAFEVAESDSAVRQQLGQKILFLRKQLPIPNRDDDVELFDDEAEVEGVAAAMSRAVIDSPGAQETADGNSCIICLTGPKEMCFVPCGHVCCCSTCAGTQSLRTCPICRAKIATRVKIFLA